jgi:phytoene/squalene synthetase
MDHDTIESAYAPFVTVLRGGGFLEPAEGWPAELVAAHVARNNDFIAEMAERIADGQQPEYDNAIAVDDAALRAYCDEVGGIPGLADAIETSARRLAAARASLDETTESYELPAIIRDGGNIVNDGAIPIGRFIEGNASFHLDLHFEQLKALRS